MNNQIVRRRSERFGVAIAVVWILGLFAAAPAAQVQTGILVVKVVDDQGGVIPGVSVSVTSPVLPRELTGVTDTGGIYQLPA